MTEPRRPPAPRPWTERARQRLAERRDEFRDRRAGFDSTVPFGATSNNPERPMLPEAPTRLPGVGIGAVIAVGAVLLAVGAIWGFGAWSNRSAPPIDDQLEFLVEAPTSDAEASATPEPVATVSESAVPVASSTDNTTADRTEKDGNDPTPDALIVVHVAGAVEQPGVVELAPGSRVHEAIAAAGGAVAAADLNRVNLAARVVDGEQLHIPLVGEAHHREPDTPVRTATAVPGSANASAALLGEIDVNRATAIELELLPGVGPAIAGSIVGLREARGPFDSVDELLLVDGIGPAKLEAMRPHVIVGD